MQMHWNGCENDNGFKEVKVTYSTMERKKGRNCLYGNNTTILGAGSLHHFHFFVPNEMQELEEAISWETF